MSVPNPSPLAESPLRIAPARGGAEPPQPLAARLCRAALEPLAARMRRAARSSSLQEFVVQPRSHSPSCVRATMRMSRCRPPPSSLFLRRRAPLLSRVGEAVEMQKKLWISESPRQNDTNWQGRRLTKTKLGLGNASVAVPPSALILSCAFADVVAVLTMHLTRKKVVG